MKTRWWGEGVHSCFSATVQTKDKAQPHLVWECFLCSSVMFHYVKEGVLSQHLLPQLPSHHSCQVSFYLSLYLT